MGRSFHYRWIILLVVVSNCFGAIGDLRLSHDGNKIIWPSLESGILIDEARFSVYVGRFPVSLTSTAISVFGFQAGELSESAFFAAYGNNAGRLNTGNNVIAFGTSALFSNEGDENTALGAESFNTFTGDTPTLDVISVDPDNNQVTVSGVHGITIGDLVIYRPTGGDLPLGLSPQPEQWESISADTLECKSNSFTDTGSGVITLTPKVEYTNSTAVGFDAEPDASLQIMLGDLFITEVKTTGSFTGSGLTISSLTTGRVVLAGTAGVLEDDADLTFSGDTLTATEVVITNGFRADTDTLVVDAVNHRIGIHTDSPAVSLELEQAGDTDAIRTYGFDDRSASYVQMNLQGDNNGWFTVVGGGGIVYNISNGKFIIQHSGTTVFNMIANATFDQAQFALEDAGGNQLIICNDSVSANNYDHATQTDPTLFVQSDLNPNASNNQWGSFHHDQENFIITSGANTGVGSAPTTDENAIILAPRGTEELRAAEGLVSIANDLTVGGLVVFVPSELTVTAGGGITPVSAQHGITGSGGPVNITVNPQIAAGVAGQILTLEGRSNTDTVTIEDGDGLHLHGTAIMGQHDILVLQYDGVNSEWTEVTRNFSESEKAWSFVSPAGSSGTFYTGGYYFFNSGNNTFVAPQTLGTANISYAAHAFIVAGASPASDSIITVSGTSITDEGTRTAADSEALSVLSTVSANDYFETTKKWIGQITVTFTSGDNAVNYNWGFCKYWDNNNNNFRIIGIEVTGTAGTGNDSNPNILLIHHKASGWTYNAGSTPSPPTAVADMNTDHNTEIQFSNSQPFAWKRTNLSQVVLGGADEGTIIQWETTANKAVEIAHVLLRIRGN